MNQLDVNTRKYLYNHTSQETAYVVEDYPWGFRLRTTIRYWIETKRAKNGGQRFGSQTINPKTGQWCAPKYGTYSPIKVLYLDKNDHIQCETLNIYSSKECIEEFKNDHIGNLDDFQKEQLKDMIALNNVMEHVTFTVKACEIGPVSLFSKDPEQIAKREALIKKQEERKEEQKKNEQLILNAIYHERNKVVI